MRRTLLGLIFVALGCAEPTSTSLRAPTAPAINGRQLNSSYRIDGGSKTVYVRLAQIREESGEPVQAFVRRMFASADSADAGRLVIDLRSIAGSDARLVVPLVKGVVTRDRFAKGGRLYLVVGPDSFAPTQSAATLLQRYANPILVHELP